MKVGAGARGDGRLERHRTARGAVVESAVALAGRRVGGGGRAGELGVHLRVAALRVDGLRVGHAGRRAKAELNLHRRLVEIERVVVGDLRVRQVAIDALVNLPSVESSRCKRRQRHRTRSRGRRRH